MNNRSCTVWAVIATEAGYFPREVPIDADSASIMALYPDKAAAEQAINRITLLQEQLPGAHGAILQRERDLRSMLPEEAVKDRDASIAHELAIRNKMLHAVHEIAMPRGTAGGDFVTIPRLN